MADFTMMREGERVAVGLGSKLTAADVPALQSELRKEIAAAARTIVFDFSSVETLDSSGIGLLVAANNSLAGVGGSVSLENVSPELLKLLKSMRLVDRLRAKGRD